MSKRVVVTIPDNYNRENAIERIKAVFDYNPKIIVETGENVNGKLGEIIKAVGDFQMRLKEIDKL